MLPSSLNILLDDGPVRGLGIFRRELPLLSVNVMDMAEGSEPSIVAARVGSEELPESSIVDESSPMERASLGSILQEAQVPERSRRRARRSPSVSSGVRRRRSKRSKASGPALVQEVVEEKPAPSVVGSSASSEAPVEEPLARVAPVEGPRTIINPEAHRYSSWDEEPEAMRQEEGSSPLPASKESSSGSPAAAASRIRLSTRPRQAKVRQEDVDSQEGSSTEPPELAAPLPDSFPKPAWVLRYYPDLNQVRGLLR